MADFLWSPIATLDRWGADMLDWVLWMNLWTAMLLAGALLLDRAFRRRISASWRLVLFLTVLVRLFVPVSAHSPIGAFAGPWPTYVSDAAAVPAVPAMDASSGEADNRSSAAGGATLLALVPILYGAVALTLLVAWWHSARRLLGIIDESRAIGGENAATIARAIPELDPGRIREHANAGPLLIGFARPILVLPTRLFSMLGDDAIKAVVRHEHAHLVRKDSLLAALLHLAVVAAWPVLAIWLASARVRALMELACDERALSGSAPHIRADYGRALLAFATGKRAPPAALTFAGGLSERLAAIKDSQRWNRAAQVAVVSPVAVLLVACAGQRPPEAPPVHDATGAMNQRRLPAVYRNAVPEPHKGSQEVRFTVLEEAPLHPRLVALAPRTATHGVDPPSRTIPSSQFDALLAEAGATVLARPRVYAVLGMPFSIDVGSTDPGGKMITGVAINARVAMIQREPGESRWTYRLEINYSEALDGATIAGPLRRDVSVHPGETAVIRVPAQDGHADRLLCVSANRAPPLASEATQSAAPPTPQTSQSFAPTPSSFDPLGGEYPQVLWMLNIYEVPGPVEISDVGLVTMTRKAKPGSFASIDGAHIPAAMASIDAIAGRAPLATPAMIQKFDVEGAIKSEVCDKDGRSPEHRSITIRSAPAKAGIEATFEFAVSADATSVSTRVANRIVPAGGAVVMSAPGLGVSDPWTVLVARPRVLLSVKDYPFQTAPGPPG